MHRLVSHRGGSPASLAVPFDHLLACLHDTSLDGCHLEVISFRNGCQVQNNSHLITWGLDTAPIGDLRCCEVERWSLGGVVHPQRPGKLVGAVLRLVFGATSTSPGSPAQQGRFFLSGILLL